MKKSIILALLFLFLPHGIVSSLTSDLTQLMRTLIDLEEALKKLPIPKPQPQLPKPVPPIAKKIIEQEKEEEEPTIEPAESLPGVPGEITANVLEQMLSQSITTPEQLVQIVQSLSELGRTNRTNLAWATDPQLLKELKFRIASDQVISGAIRLLMKDKSHIILKSIEQLLNNSARQIKRFKDAVKTNNRDQIVEFFDQGFNPNIFIDNMPLLHFLVHTIEMDNLSVIDELLKIGTDINFINNSDPANPQTALSVALSLKQNGADKTTLIHYLVDHGALFLPSVKHVLAIPARQPNETIQLLIKYLVDNNLNANSLVEETRRVLQIPPKPFLAEAVDRNLIDLVRFLLEHHADPNQGYQSQWGATTPLERAQHFQRYIDPEIVSLLEQYSNQ